MKIVEENEAQIEIKSEPQQESQSKHIKYKANITDFCKGFILGFILSFFSYFFEKKITKSKTQKIGLEIGRLTSIFLLIFFCVSYYSYNQLVDEKEYRAVLRNKDSFKVNDYQTYLKKALYGLVGLGDKEEIRQEMIYQNKRRRYRKRHQIDVQLNFRILSTQQFKHFIGKIQSIITNMKSTISLFENQDSPMSLKKDRFISQRSTSSFSMCFNNPSENYLPEQENLEQQLYQQILQENLLQKTQKNMNFVDQQKFKVPCVFQKNKRKQIPKSAFKVLDAPFLQDDYYLNVLDWGRNSKIAVGLGNTVYLWSFQTNEVEKIAYFDNFNLVSNVTFDIIGSKVIIGTLNGTVQLWDLEQKQKIFEMRKHQERVGAISYYGNMLVTGSRDRKINLFDIRQPQRIIQQYDNHKQEVCGLKWNYSGTYFASGGNDNKMFVFSPKSKYPLMKKKHKAAVKALDWSSKKLNLLASGAGSADRKLRIWDTQTNSLIVKKDTGSQICNLRFLKDKNEIVTSHGFSNNEICLWDLKNLQKKATLSGHTQRVLYLSMSPCGKFIVSGAGDETLRFWKISMEKNEDQIQIKKNYFKANFPRQLNCSLINDQWQNKVLKSFQIKSLQQWIEKKRQINQKDQRQLLNFLNNQRTSQFFQTIYKITKKVLNKKN